MAISFSPKHPPYDEMIYTAIGALKERDGSSKRAIGKYIEQVYKDLPPTHPALLTHHLNRLKSSALLVLVKKSYKLPGSHHLPALQPQKTRGRPPKPKPVVRPGRPQKLAVGRSKNPVRRPVGRPKGSTAAAITAHKAANEDLRKKLEHFQSKVKESLGTLKPYFNHESPVTAIAAIQELEVLSTLDLKAPLRDETQQQPPPQPLPQTQTQVYEQQYPQPQSQQLPQFFQPHTSAPS
ncbi:Histone H1.2 [Glycine soja]|uniref:Histone H1.2 n=1 Tax=Glycine soja TaxID=3848 RepID=A0A0B2PRZ9_GLYSO|nr:Histone H1.2 [Glycine soja]